MALEPSIHRRFEQASVQVKAQVRAQVYLQMFEKKYHETRAALNYMRLFNRWVKRGLLEAFKGGALWK